MEESDSPIVAEGTLIKIIESYEKLEDFPYMGIELSSKIDMATDYRFLDSGKYIVFYKVDDVYVSYLSNSLYRKGLYKDSF